MYRIRLASGAETTYHSIDEFAAALHGGTVTAEALIYHQRADRWLSVTNHPHYQIALSRGSTAAKSDGAKRQVISAVRPATEVPATRIAPKPEVPPSVARPAAEAPRKLTIPTPKKPESGPLRAHENVLEGVVVTRPETPRTTVLPVRSIEPSAARPPVKAVEPKVPDLGEGLDLVEDDAAVTPASRPSMATPQVDKLLEMLAPEAVPAPAMTAAPDKPEVELLDLGAPLAKPAAPVQVEQPQADLLPVPTPTVSKQAQSHGKSLTMIGLGAAAVIALGAVLFFWKPWSSKALPEGTDIASTTLPRTEAFGGSSANPAAPTTAEITGSPLPSGGQPVDSSGRQARQADSAPAIVRVAAPRNIKISAPTTNLIATNDRSGLNISATELIRHYNVAYTEARSDLELRMLQIGFTQIFLRSRLTSSSGVQDTRRLIASATSALRQYRSQETQIERSYQDTIGGAGRNLGWSARELATWNMRPDQKESAETLRLTNLMLSQMDSLFSLLAEQEGKYHISGESIAFENAESARQYAALRVWLNQQADKYAGTGDALPATLRQVVKAIGATRLPQERR
jgi:hypothetical protein